MYDESKCQKCGRCSALCEQECHIFNGKDHIFKREACTACGKCQAPLCEAIALSGYEISAEEVIEEVLKDSVFYKRSNGGITLSGGEPLAQGDFSVSILKLAKENQLNTAVETCGFVPKESVIKSAKYTDIYLFDIKETDSELHRRFTGCDNAQILENLDLINTLGKDIILRCPLIPGFNCREEHIIAIARLANSLEHVIAIELEPYHDLGISKYKKLGREYSVDSNASDTSYCDTYAELLKKYTGKPVKNIRA